MRLNILILLVVTGVVFSLTWSMQTRTPPVQNVPVSKDTPQNTQNHLPAFDFKTLDGQGRKSADLKGRILLLNLWATWCAPCVIEFPRLVDLAAAYPDKVTLLALSIDREAEKVERFLGKFKQDTKNKLQNDNILIALDSDQKIALSIFNTVRVPETIIVAPDGTMVDKIAGAEWETADLRAIIDRIDGNQGDKKP